MQILSEAISMGWIPIIWMLKNMSAESSAIKSNFPYYALTPKRRKHGVGQKYLQ